MGCGQGQRARKSATIWEIKGQVFARYIFLEFLCILWENQKGLRPDLRSYEVTRIRTICRISMDQAIPKNLGNGEVGQNVHPCLTQIHRRCIDAWHKCTQVTFMFLPYIYWSHTVVSTDFHWWWKISPCRSINLTSYDRLWCNFMPVCERRGSNSKRRVNEWFSASLHPFKVLMGFLYQNSASRHPGLSGLIWDKDSHTQLSVSIFSV